MKRKVVLFDDEENIVLKKIEEKDPSNNSLKYEEAMILYKMALLFESYKKLQIFHKAIEILEEAVYFES